MRELRRGGLVDQVIDQLSGEITSGAWAVGARLPSVAELADGLGVGRSTVREAVQALAHRGVLEVHQGRGTFVADSGHDVEERTSWLRRAAMLDVFEARRGLEIDAARLAALRRTPADLEVISEAAAERRRAKSGGVVDEWAAADLALHRAVLAATHNPVLVRLFDELSAAMITAFEQQTADLDSSVDTEAEHDALAVAIDARDPHAAMRATVGYLEASERELRTLLTGEGQDWVPR